MQPLPARRVGVPRTWKGFGHEKSSVNANDRCHHRYHCLGDTITSSGAAGRLGWLECRSHGRTNCWYGDRWNSGRRRRPWPRLLLLPRTGRRLRSRILRPLVLYGVSIRSVIARCDAEVRTTTVAERSAAFFVPTRVWLDATKVMRRSKRKWHLSPSSISDAAQMPDLAAQLFKSCNPRLPAAYTSLKW